MKYIIYLLVGLLILWSVWYLFRHLGKQLRGGCGGDCARCGGCSMPSSTQSKGREQS